VDGALRVQARSGEYGDPAVPRTRQALVSREALITGIGEEARAIGLVLVDGRQIVGFCPRCGKPILLGTSMTWKDGIPTDGIATDPYHTCGCWK